MGQYALNVQATSNTTINTDDTFIEVKAATGVIFKIKRVRVGFGDGTQTAGVDNHFRIKFMRWDTTTAGAGGTATINAKNANLAAASATAKVKSGVTALALGTTNVQTVDIISVNGRALYEFLARDEEDYIVVKPASCFGLVLSSAVVSQLFTVTVEWIE